MGIDIVSYIALAFSVAFESYHIMIPAVMVMFLSVFLRNLPVIIQIGIIFVMAGASSIFSYIFDGYIRDGNVFVGLIVFSSFIVSICSGVIGLCIGGVLFAKRG